MTLNGFSNSNVDGHVQSFKILERIKNPILRAEFQTYLSDIDVTKADNGDRTAPTPKGFTARLIRRAHSGRYTPSFTPIGTKGNVTPDIYSPSFRYGHIPFSAFSSLFFHDVASQHSLAYLKYGDPLTELLAAFAYYEPLPDQEDSWSLTGQHGNNRPDRVTTRMIDPLTDFLTEDEFNEPETPPEDFDRALPTIADRLNQVPRTDLRHIQVVASAIEHNNLAEEDRLTGEMLRTELERLARIPSQELVAA